MFSKVIFTLYNSNCTFCPQWYGTSSPEGMNTAHSVWMRIDVVTVWQHDLMKFTLNSETVYNSAININNVVTCCVNYWPICY